MTVVVIAHYRAKPDTHQAVADALAAMIEPSRAEIGNLEYRVCRDPADPHTFLIFEEYLDEAAFRTHLATPHFAQWLQGVVLPRLAERTRFDLVPLDTPRTASRP